LCDGNFTASGGPDKIKKLLIGFSGCVPGAKSIDREKEFEHLAGKELKKFISEK
jgi:hypothetical protein